MSRQAIAAQASRFVTRAARSSNLRYTSSQIAPAACRAVSCRLNPSQRAFSTCPALKSIMPDSDGPGKEAAKTQPTYAVAEMSEIEYHEVADNYLDIVLTKFEALQDAREDFDVEYSAGVMTIAVPHKGTYVLNKQPPNKQIWLSSPISGPKRYDWCIVGDGQGEKEGTGSGSWIYARDGTSLDQLVLSELGVDIHEPVEG